MTVRELGARAVSSAMRAFGQSLRFHIGEHVVATGVGPVPLVERRFLRLSQLVWTTSSDN